MSSDFDRRVDEFFRNYHDRGMKKWAGFFLSDHTLKINQDQKKRTARLRYVKKPTMSMENISAVLLKAFGEHWPVRLQLKEVNQNDQVQADITGFVSGYKLDKVVVGGQKIALADINHIEISRDG